MSDCSEREGCECSSHRRTADDVIAAMAAETQTATQVDSLTDLINREYVNLSQLARGCVSGRLSEWPMLKTEAARALAHIDGLTKQRDELVSTLRMSITNFCELARQTLEFESARRELQVKLGLHPLTADGVQVFLGMDVFLVAGPVSAEDRGYGRTPDWHEGQKIVEAQVVAVGSLGDPNRRVSFLGPGWSYTWSYRLDRCYASRERAEAAVLEM